MTQQQLAKPKPETSKTEQVDEVEGLSPERQAEVDALKAETDAIMDEIDSVLEQNAEEFVANYIQKPGE